MDQQLLFLVNRSWAAAWLDRPMAIASSWDFWWPFVVIGALVLVVAGGFRGRAFVAVAGLAVGINDGVVVRAFKDLTQRPRPHEVLEGVRTLDLGRASPRVLAVGMPLKSELSVARARRPGGNSFPSGHASNSFALATACALFFRGRGWLAYLPAAVVAYSRVYVGAHWPLDVAVSALLGTGIALLVAAACEALWRRFAPRLLPGLAARHPVLIGP